MVFVHGWAQSSQTWHAQRSYFGRRGEVHAPNLPGHGGTADRPTDAWEDALLAAFPERPVILVGWSLGGMLALSIAARHPERLVGLVLLSTTPSFRCREGWAHGCSDEVFAGFCDAMTSDTTHQLERFVALMLQGDDLQRRQYLAIVRQAVDRQHPVSPAGLHSGLQRLDTMDLRAVLSDIGLPALVVHGEHDAVVPVQASHFLAANLPRARLELLPAGHAPHLTQADKFNTLVEEWCPTLTSTHAR